VSKEKPTHYLGLFRILHLGRLLLYSKMLDSAIIFSRNICSKLLIKQQYSSIPVHKGTLKYYTWVGSCFIKNARFCCKIRNIHSN